ncbi:MAG: response regulator transcription factor [Deltaproteobacteria bacterium]|nr:response regulator transcription factor [Deltaproteobacteria bacterium]
MLERAERYVDAAAMVCEEARLLGVRTTILFLHGEAGPPVMIVDNATDVTDEFRMTNGIGETVWKVNPVFIVLRQRLGMIGSEVLATDYLPIARQFGYTGAPLQLFAIPLLGADGWFGTMVCGNLEPIPLDLERRLTLLATRLSVWCTERGVGRVPQVTGDGDLPARRYRIAQLAASGQTNSEIAQYLGISINTVKSRLKQVFAQLDVDNRTELALTLRRLAPVRDVKLGVTQIGEATVTRVAHPIGYSATARRSATSG